MPRIIHHLLLSRSSRPARWAVTACGLAFLIGLVTWLSAQTPSGGGKGAAQDLEILRDGRGAVLAVRNKAASRPKLAAQAAPASPLKSAAVKGASVAKGVPAVPGIPRVPEATAEEKHAMMAKAGAHLAPLAGHFKVAMGDLRAEGARTDHLGMSHVHYRQVRGGVPVFGSELIVHLGPEGDLSSANGRTLDWQGREPDTTPAISAGAAAAAAVAIAEAPLPDGAKPEPPCCGGAAAQDPAAPVKFQALTPPRLWLYNRGFLLHSAETPTHLVWEVVIGVPDGKVSETFYINARDSSLVERRSNVQRLNRNVFDCTSFKTDGTCIMDFGLARFYNFFVFGRSEGRPARGSNPVPGPAFGSTDVDKLYDYVPVIEQYYLDKFGRNGGNDHGGIGDGSASDPYGDTTMFADINQTLPLGVNCAPGWGGFNNTTIFFCAFSVGDDTFAHEYGHMVARYKSFNLDGTPNSLLYLGESGALNESNSDIFGEAFEFYHTGSADWMVGTGCNQFGIRSLADPPSVVSPPGTSAHYPYPDRYHHPDFYRGDTSFDAGGVHTNSSVPNKAAYLTAMGGTFNGRTITGIGLAKVEQIWYRALTTYYTNSETFNGAYVALRQACADLYPASDLAQLTAALQAVETDLPPLLPLPTDADLFSLEPGTGTLTPRFARATVNYTVTVPNATTTITFTPIMDAAGATATVNGSPVASAAASQTINLNLGPNTITVVVTATDGTTKKTYTVVVTRAAPPASDFNGDLKSDLVWQNTTTGDRVIWFMNGTAFAGSASLGTIATAWQIAAIGDFNGDGKPDLLWQNTVTGDRTIWFMNGATRTGYGSLGTVATAWQIAGTGDFNGDGKPDILWQNTVTGARTIWLMNGTTITGYRSLGTVSTDWQIAAVADLNGDGNPDILWQNTVTGARTIWFMNGTTFTGYGSLGVIPTAWQIAGAGDFNGDGNSDIIWQNIVTGQRFIWFMNGTAHTGGVDLGTIPIDWKIRD